MQSRSAIDSSNSLSSKNLIGKGGVGFKLHPASLNFLSLQSEVRFLRRSVNGKAKPGRLLVIMGPSGSRKMTLLDVRAYKYAYVRQKDLFFSQLTVRKTLALAAELQLLEISFLEESDEYVNNLLFKTSQNTGKSFDVLRLQLPVIKISSLKVLFEDRRTYASLTMNSVKESLWNSLEEDMIPSLSTARTNWLELQSKLLPQRYKDSNICVAGEAIKVDVEFENPLKIPISVSGVSLICEHFELDETKSDESSSAPQLWKEKGYKNLGEMSSDTSLYTLSEINFTLKGNETTLVQLRVTPKVEGSLKIVGIRWKLSGSIVGYYNLESNLAKRKIAKGRKTKRTPSSDLEFIVIKSLPKLEGSIRSLPEKAYAGDLRHLVLELKNQSEFSVKNLKMNISHPRFLSIGNHEDLDLEFPDCLEKKNSARNDVPDDSKKVSCGPFLFPEHISIKKEKPLLWPLWLRASVPGNVSLYVVLYYEVGDASSVMKYRTLRMHYNLQVLPSLDVSFTISPCPSRLQEFLVRMDVVNKTSSESFQLNQLSSVGLWEISLLQPADAIFPSSLIAGQALSCFFMLKTQRKSLTEEKQSVLSHGSDVRLAPKDNKDALFDLSCSPLADFHDCERLHQEKSNQEAANTADFILISRSLESDTIPENSSPLRIFSHHACHCSTGSKSPISWIMDGPWTRHHNFSASFCVINLKITLYNSSEAVASVGVNTVDSTSGNGEITQANAVTFGNETGWHNMPTVTDIKVTSESPRTNVEKSPAPKRVFPFVWSGTSSTRVQLGPLSCKEIPLQISVFSPGTFDLSNYTLTWNLLPVNEGGSIGDKSTQTSGTCLGYPFYLTVLQSD